MTGLVDWDLAGPGRLIADFVYMAWHFTALHPDIVGDGTTGPPTADRPRRLRLLADTYGLTVHQRQAFLGVRRRASPPGSQDRR